MADQFAAELFSKHLPVSSIFPISTPLGTLSKEDILEMARWVWYCAEVSGGIEPKGRMSMLLRMLWGDPLSRLSPGDVKQERLEL